MDACGPLPTHPVWLAPLPSMSVPLLPFSCDPLFAHSSYCSCPMVSHCGWLEGQLQNLGGTPKLGTDGPFRCPRCANWLLHKGRKFDPTTDMYICTDCSALPSKWNLVSRIPPRSLRASILTLFATPCDAAPSRGTTTTTSAVRPAPNDSESTELCLSTPAGCSSATPRYGSLSLLYPASCS